MTQWQSWLHVPPPSLTAELIRLIIKVNDDGRVGVHFKSECVFM